MGAFTVAGNGMNKCDGQDVLTELNAVFSDESSNRYDYAKTNNTFDAVKSDDDDNYKALIAAYVEAGVDVCARWGAYLRILGRSPQGRQDIFVIAQTRYNALNGNVPIQTTYHGTNDGGHGGRHVKKHDGSSHNDPSTINAPFDP
jgi:hypothetical protein